MKNSIKRKTNITRWQKIVKDIKLFMGPSKVESYIVIWLGGREAGYNNTCGSDIGWAPKTFISSRTKRGNFQENYFILATI